MIYLLMRLKSFFVQFVDVVFLAPNDIPIISIGFLVAFLIEGLVDAIGKVGFVFDDGTRVKESCTKKSGIPF